MTKNLVASIALVLCTSSFAAEDPEFLLDTYGARIDLPSGWEGKPGSWTSESFEASASAGKLLFFSWGTEFQSPLDANDLAAWEERMVAKAKGRGMSKAKLTSSEVRSFGKRKVALFEIEVEASGGKGLMFGASEMVDGHVFHMMVMSGRRMGRTGRAAIEAFVERLDVQAPPAKLDWGGEVSASGHTATLPSDWRPVLKSEQKALVPHLRDLGLALNDCWTAIRPHGPGKPDVMVGCSAPMWLGVVDEYSFGGVDPELRAKMFGKAPIAPAQRRELGEFTGFAYSADLGDRKMAVGAVPYDEGVFRIWALGEVELGSDLDAVLASSTFTGSHPADLSALASYYVSYRPFSPVVLGGVGVILLFVFGGLGGLVLMTRRKSTFDDDDDDDDLVY